MKPGSKAKLTPEAKQWFHEKRPEQIRDLDWKAILLASQTANEPPYFEIENYDNDNFDIDNYVTYE